MKYLALIILLTSTNLFANNVQYFADDNLVNNTSNESEAESSIINPLEGHDDEDAPISDYQYTLLVLAIGVGVYGISKNNKQKII